MFLSFKNSVPPTLTFFTDGVACREPVAFRIGAATAKVRVGELRVDRVGFNVFVGPAKAPVRHANFGTEGVSRIEVVRAQVFHVVSVKRCFTERGWELEFVRNLRVNRSCSKICRHRLPGYRGVFRECILRILGFPCIRSSQYLPSATQIQTSVL